MGKQIFYDTFKIVSVEESTLAGFLSHFQSDKIDWDALHIHEEK